MKEAGTQGRWIEVRLLSHLANSRDGARHHRFIRFLSIECIPHEHSSAQKPLVVQGSFQTGKSGGLALATGCSWPGIGALRRGKVMLMEETG